MITIALHDYGFQLCHPFVTFDGENLEIRSAARLSNAPTFSFGHIQLGRRYEDVPLSAVTISSVYIRGI